MIGIERDRYAVYEGNHPHATQVWPTPVVTVATPLLAPGDGEKVPQNNNLYEVPIVFREDFYDPVTRIRRGRFYHRGEGQPVDGWRVQPYPGYVADLGMAGGRRDYEPKTLFTFRRWPARLHLKCAGSEVLVVLGVQSAMTYWRVIAVEHISSGEDLVTLKARSNLGVIPELNEHQVRHDAPGDEVLQRMKQTLATLVDAAYQAGPESVIDRCCNGAVALLGAYFGAADPKASTQELAALADIARGKKRYVVENIARALALLHPRAKPNEQVKRGARQSVEEDAQFAIESVAMIMREIGWAR